MMSDATGMRCKRAALAFLSAGGVDVDATTTYSEEPTPSGMVGMRLEITGLQGGHSGIDINHGRGNAIKLLARLLWSAQEEIDLRVAPIVVGERYNAIPREATVLVAVPKTEAASLTATVQAFLATERRELAATEPNLVVTASPPARLGRAVTREAQRRIVGAL